MTAYEYEVHPSLDTDLMDAYEAHDEDRDRLLHETDWNGNVSELVGHEFPLLEPYLPDGITAEQFYAFVLTLAGDEKPYFDSIDPVIYDALCWTIAAQVASVLGRLAEARE